VPELLVVDNGREFYSRHFEDACLQLAVRVDHAPPRSGAYKGTVERWFGTHNTRLLHELPGTTFSDIFERGDYDPVKHAVISLDALLELVHVWVVDVYHQQVQRGLGDIPYRRWNEAAAEHPPRLPRRADELDVLVGCTAERRIGNCGIELFTLRYNSPELGLIRRALAPGQKARLKYDPTDLSAIHVLDPARNTYLAIPALDREYTHRLTLFQHDVIRRYARRVLAERVDTAALLRARQRIEEIVARERVLQRRLGARRRVARFLDLGEPDYGRVDTTTLAADAPERETAGEGVLSAAAIRPVSALTTDVDEAAWRADYELPRRGEEWR
jgi:putative transposase